MKFAILGSYVVCAVGKERGWFSREGEACWMCVEQ
jgi:hypothetical protein